MLLKNIISNQNFLSFRNKFLKIHENPYTTDTVLSLRDDTTGETFPSGGHSKNHAKLSAELETSLAAISDLSEFDGHVKDTKDEPEQPVGLSERLGAVLSNGTRKNDSIQHVFSLRQCNQKDPQWKKIRTQQEQLP